MPSIVWKGHLSFGLVSIPVKLYRAARRERVRMHYVHRPVVSEETPDEPKIIAQDVPVKSAQRSAQQIEAFPPRLEPQREAPEAPAPISRVRQALVTPSGERPIASAEVLKGYEVEPDRYVVFDREELKG